MGIGYRGNILMIVKWGCFEEWKHKGILNDYIYKNGIKAWPTTLTKERQRNYEEKKKIPHHGMISDIWNKESQLLPFVFRMCATVPHVRFFSLRPLVTGDLKKFERWEHLDNRNKISVLREIHRHNFCP